MSIVFIIYMHIDGSWTHKDEPNAKISISSKSLIKHEGLTIDLIGLTQIDELLY